VPAQLPGEDVVADAEDVLRVYPLLEGADDVQALRGGNLVDEAAAQLANAVVVGDRTPGQP
jgi:hypothetical protein